MSTASEGQFKHGDATFYSKTWTPEGPIVAKVVYVHGFSEHVNCYNEFFPKIADKGIQVLSWDQRGWGRSVTKPSEKGLTGPTSQVIADVAAFITEKLPAKDDASAVPIFVMGHSMGGGEVLTLAGDPQYAQLVSQIRGWIVECPFVGFTPGEEPSSFKIFAGRLAGRVLPKFQLKHVIPLEYLTRDEAVVQAIRDDPLCHDTGTLEGLASLLDRTAHLSSSQFQLGKQVQSLLLLHGSGDRVCSYDAAVHLVEQQSNIQDKTVKTYPGAYHQLHTDLCKDEYAKDLVEWILQHSSENTVNDSPAPKL